MPKKFGCEPAASTSASPAHSSPSVALTVFAAVSTAAISASLTSTFSLPGEHAAQRVRDVARRELRGGHLVEQRLELVMVVAVDERDRHVFVVGEALRAAETREASADDHDVALVGRWSPWSERRRDDRPRNVAGMWP